MGKACLVFFAAQSSAQLRYRQAAQPHFSRLRPCDDVAIVFFSFPSFCAAPSPLPPVHSVRARCARLRDALQRLEASAARAHTDGKGPIWTPDGVIDRELVAIEDGALAKPDAGVRVLRGLEKSEARLAVLQNLAATLSQVCMASPWLMPIRSSIPKADAEGRVQHYLAVVFLNCWIRLCSIFGRLQSQDASVPRDIMLSCGSNLILTLHAALALSCSKSQGRRKAS